MIIYLGTSHFSNHSSESDSDSYLICAGNHWYFKTYMSKPPLKQTSGSNNLNSATSRVWSSSRERSSPLPWRCSNANFSACFDWDLRDRNATVTAPALNHRPISNLDLLSLSNTLCRGYFEPPMNIPHVQLGNTSSKEMVRKRSQPHTYSRTTSTDSAFALEDIHFAGSPLSRWRAISGTLLVGWFVMVWGLKTIAGQGQRRDKRDGDII